MPLKSFEIENQKAIRYAECHNVPPLMIIAGPNGVGKSTLLYSIKINQGNIDMTGTSLYIPPHRALRRQKIMLRSLWGNRRSYSEGLATNKLSAVEGVNILDGSRVPESTDESMSFMKYTLTQIETRRQTAITNSIDNNELAYPSGSVPNVYRPLKDLTKNLLPHLEFSRIDVSSRDNVRCLWKRATGLDLSYGGTTEIDIDELSSGEKAIIGLFLPFIEQQIETIIQEIEGETNQNAESLDQVVLIDEPELHLHPALQAGMLNYLRQIVQQEGIQFIIVTQSPTILDAATEDELYVLTPEPDWPERTNQLVHLTDRAERLELMRILCGETYPVTACKPIVCIEGELPEDKPSKPVDKRIYEIICQDLNSILVPMGSKSVVINAAKKLRAILPSNIPGLNIFALRDRDFFEDGQQDEDWVFKLPVCMIENLLLKPSAISNLIEPYKEKSQVKDVRAVESTLKQIAKGLREDEIRLRVKKQLKPINESISGETVDKIKEKRDKILESIQNHLPADKELIKIVEDARNEVDNILSRKEELDLFRGKEILKKFYDQHMKPLGFSYHTFCIELAKEVSKESEHNSLLKMLFSHIQSFVPKDLFIQLESLERLINDSSSIQTEKRTEIIAKIDPLLSECKEAVNERLKQEPIRINRRSLRDKIMQMARFVEQNSGLDIEGEKEIKEVLTEIRLLSQKVRTQEKVA